MVKLGAMPVLLTRMLKYYSAVLLRQRYREKFAGLL